MMRVAALVLGLSLTGAAHQPGPGPGQDATPAYTREVYLMGTRATLATWDSDRARAVARLEALLTPIEETEAQLSTWRDDSEIARLNAAAGAGAIGLSPSLCAVFREIGRWVGETGGAFDPAIGALTAAWDVHGRGHVPDAGALDLARRHSGWARVGFEPAACTVRVPQGTSLDVGGFGKGEALDRARSLEVARDGAWLIDLGGQVAAGGAALAAGPAVPIDIAHPLRRTEPFRTCAITSGSLSTSGGSERDLRVHGQRVGHILDPRTGRPAAFHGSVTVWHERALVADILSTALFVMGAKHGVRWADEHGIAALFLIPETGGAVATEVSRTWSAACATTSP